MTYDPTTSCTTSYYYLLCISFAFPPGILTQTGKQQRPVTVSRQTISQSAPTRPMHAALQLQNTASNRNAGTGCPGPLVLRDATGRGHMEDGVSGETTHPDETLGRWPLSQPGDGAGEQQPARLRPGELHVERVPRV